jgi:FlaG protein
MSADFSIRPVGAPVATPIVPSASESARAAVPTQLPPSQTVTAVSTSVAAASVSLDTSDIVSRQAYFDRAAGAVVFQVVDDKTDQVVRQFPEQAVLRRRAYFRSLDLAKETSARPVATDLKA